MMKRVAILAGIRTPFIKAKKAFANIGPLELGAHTVQGMLERHAVDPMDVEAFAFGVVVPEFRIPNPAREIIFRLGLPAHIEAQTLSSYCITGLRSITAIADAITLGRITMGLAGGADSLSLASTDTFNEPSTGLSMGEHMEITQEEWDVSREEQDRIALASHRNAVSAQTKIDHEIFPLEGQNRDSGPRPDTSEEALAALDPVFKPDGTLTAGNSSPVTDGASVVLLMSEERAAKEGRTPLAFIKAMDYAALHPDEGLLMAPALTVPRILNRTGLHLREMDLIEIHEAFGAQVAANVKAWEKGWKGDPTGPLDWDRINVNGSSIAFGHPWSATGGRIVTTLANEMGRRDARFGLVSICAAGGMAGAMILERT
jgi:acetyl-CoA acetyltransferase family protein